MKKRPIIQILLSLMMLGIIGTALLFTVMKPKTVTEYRFMSEMGEHIGGGDNKQYTMANAGFALTGTLAAMNFSVKSKDGYWSVNLTAPKGEVLHTGHYDRIEPTPYRHEKLPILAVSSNGAECNSLFGEFTIKQMGTDDSGAITMLEATFTQHCESATGPQLRGDIKYNVPENPISQ